MRIGHYEIKELIGAGGMGEVHKAIDTKTQRIVALKMIKGQSGTDKAFQRFSREIMITSKLNHPHIIKVHDVVEDDQGKSCLIMDFIEGKPLTNLSKKDYFSIAQTFLLILNAIEYAHEEGVIHRDIKSSNILLDREENPIVMDFGLARSYDSNTLTASQKVIMGSLPYMSPEQANGMRKEINHMSDIYSLGVVLYEMITGRVPFQGRSYQEVAPQIFKKLPPKPREIKEDIPDDLQWICLKALEKQKENRYQSVKEMTNDLQRFLAGKKVKARPSLFVPVVVWAKQNKKLLIINTIIIIAIVLALIVVKSR